MQKNADIVARWLDAMTNKDMTALRALYANGASHHTPAARKDKRFANGLVPKTVGMKKWWGPQFKLAGDTTYELMTTINPDGIGGDVDFTYCIKKGRSEKMVRQRLIIDKDVILFSQELPVQQ